jgi:hypothetical protein
MVGLMVGRRPRGAAAPLGQEVKHQRAGLGVHELVAAGPPDGLVTAS